MFRDILPGVIPLDNDPGLWIMVSEREHPDEDEMSERFAENCHGCQLSCRPTSHTDRSVYLDASRD